MVTDNNSGYIIRTSKRKSLQITVKRNLDVIVSIPYGTPSHLVKNFIAARAKWIEKQQNYFKQLAPKNIKQYISGEYHYYLGNRYELQIHQSKKNFAELTSHLSIFHNGSYNSQKIEKTLRSWYRERAREIFENRLQFFQKKLGEFQNYSIKLQIRRMKSRWGSLHRSGAMTLNSELVKTSLECIDYVIIHELCHLKHPNHSRSFYKKLEKHLPDYKHRKQQLENSPL